MGVLPMPTGGHVVGAKGAPGDLRNRVSAIVLPMPNGAESSLEQSPGEVDMSLVDALRALSPEGRLRHNDRMLRTIELLRQGIAEKGADNAR